MRGYMTAWLQPNADMIVTEQKILSLIRKGMEDDTYTNNEVQKLSYIGVRDTKDGSVSSTVTNEAKKKTELESKNPPLLAIGLAVFFFALALTVAFTLYVKRRRNSSEAIQETLSPPPPTSAIDPDDINLLPSHEKMDMRSVHSAESDVSTEDATEAYTHEEDRQERVEDDLEEQQQRATAGSTLAAMGVASTVVTNMSSPQNACD